VSRAIAVLLLFLVSVALGVVIHLGVATPPAAVDRFPTINPGAPEPPVSAAITKAIAAKDPQALAAAYSADLLQAFQEAMSPVVDVDDIRYVGGLQRGSETLASYVVTGQDQNGQSLMSGFVIHVQDGQITGFN
jgi:hypothetical protein